MLILSLIMLYWFVGECVVAWTDDFWAETTHRGAFVLKFTWLPMLLWYFFRVAKAKFSK
jgi:hypothetical protein